MIYVKENLQHVLKDKIYFCELCNRNKELTFHHLIPKCLHSNKWYKKNYTREELNKGIYLCEDCHSEIHKLITEKKMGKYYNTLERLHKKVKNYVNWIKKQK